MKYSRFVPNPNLQRLVDCYWIVEGNDMSSQKIIPDGFPELIFHFGDPYNILGNDQTMVRQSLAIAAGQLDNPIVLQPSGKSGVFGIKFKPAGMWKILKCDMHELTNQTYDLYDVAGKNILELTNRINTCSSYIEMIDVVDNYLLKDIEAISKSDEMDFVIEGIHKNKGQSSISELAATYQMSTRKLERLFQQRIGLTAKMYARLIRFKHVYGIIQQPSVTKSEASYLAGYFDQAHFNKDFKQFTGESPDAYFSNNHSFSNFFHLVSTCRQARRILFVVPERCPLRQSVSKKEAHCFSC